MRIRNTKRDTDLRHGRRIKLPGRTKVGLSESIAARRSFTPRSRSDRKKGGKDEEMTGDVVEHVLGDIGMALAFVLFLSPLPTIKRIWSKKDSQDFSSDPYISGLLNCGVWTIYALPGVTPNRTEPFITNLVGFLFQLLFCVIFLLFPSKTAHFLEFEMLRKKFFGSIAFLVMMGILALILVSANASASASEILGGVASFLNIVMYAAPLSIMKKVWQSQSVEFMPLPLSIATFMCSFAWMCYGFHVGDLPIIFCNVAGVLLGLVQLLLYLYIAKQAGGLARDGDYTSILQSESPIKVMNVDPVDDNAFDDHAML
jgi:solute carrier family 50 (sugar transporter)